MITPRGIGLSLNADLIDGDMPTLERHLGHVADSGCEYVELILHGLDVVVGGRLSQARLDAVTRILDRFELRRTLHLPYELNLLSAGRHDACYACFAAGVEFARAACCEVVTYHSPFMQLDQASQHSDFWRDPATARAGASPRGRRSVRVCRVAWAARSAVSRLSPPPACLMASMICS